MSVAQESRFAISIRPRISADQERLTAATSRIVVFFTLAFRCRQVVVDRSAQTVTIRTRSAWFFQREERIPFSQIAAVTYGYEDLHPLAFLSSAHDAVDCYRAGLLKVGGGEVSLFSFYGDGSFTNDGSLPDWWYWEEYVLDRVGPQERESRIFVQLLSKLIGVSIAPSTLTRE